MIVALLGLQARAGVRVHAFARGATETESDITARAALGKCVATKRDITAGIASTSRLLAISLVVIRSPIRRDTIRDNSTEKSTRRAIEASSQRKTQVGSI
jgi:hypothetical protein